MLVVATAQVEAEAAARGEEVVVVPPLQHLPSTDLCQHSTVLKGVILGTAHPVTCARAQDKARVVQVAVPSLSLRGQRGASPRVFGGSTMQPTPSTGVVSISPKTRNKQKVSNVTSRTDYAPPQDASATERILSPPYDENGVDMDQAQRTPYREAFSSTGRRYFYNVVTRTSTYREPAMYIPYEG